VQASQLFNNIGLGSVDIGIFIIALLVLWIVTMILFIINVVKMNKLKRRLDIFMGSRSSARSLEKEIEKMFEDHKFIKAATEKNKKDISNIYRKLKVTYQKVGLVKYDAFNQMGGQLSFSLVLLNERNDGVILNSVHSTDGCYSYAKEIIGGKCSIDLGEEEQMALDQALRIDEDE